MRLQDAGFREQAWAREMIERGDLPREVTFEDFLAHGTYDPAKDEIGLTVKAVHRTWKVARP